MGRKKTNEEALSPELISKVMSEMGRKGGSVTGVPKGFASLKPKARSVAAKTGGKARASKLTREQRQEIARKAATARWAKNRRGDRPS
jgi:general stress protein YciG